jgi:hypothetical protein
MASALGVGAVFAALPFAALIGEPPFVLPEIERPTEGRPSKIQGKHIEPTAAGRAPVALAP